MHGKDFTVKPVSFFIANLVIGLTFIAFSPWAYADDTIDEADKALKNENWDKAIELCSSALKTNPNNPIAYHFRAIAHYNKETLDKALSDWNESIRIDPKYTKAIAARGALYTAKENYDKAIQDLSLVIAMDPKVAKSFAYRGA